ncbi:MAG: chorismate synthase, partial [Oscillospiraceae bacterium]
MSASFGKILKITVFGESHSEAIGCCIDGLPSGFVLPMDFIGEFMKRRSPGDKAYSSRRLEADAPKILSGAVDFVTTGAPLCAIIENKDGKSCDYEKLRDIPRPMHADFPAGVKFNGYNDIRGGGQFSGRLTAPLCFAGAIAVMLLE